jgi:hypothetical protein
MLLIAGPDVVRLAPALIVSDAQIAEADRIMRVAAGMRKRPAKHTCGGRTWFRRFSFWPTCMCRASCIL